MENEMKLAVVFRLEEDLARLMERVGTMAFVEPLESMDAEAPTREELVLALEGKSVLKERLWRDAVEEVLSALSAWTESVVRGEGVVTATVLSGRGAMEHRARRMLEECMLARLGLEADPAAAAEALKEGFMSL